MNNTDPHNAGRSPEKPPDLPCAEWLRHLFEGAYVVDAQRRILAWNPAAERISGYSRGEVVNSFCWNDILRHMDEDGRLLCRQGCPLHLTLSDGGEREARVYLHHKEGHRMPVLVRVFPLRDGAGRINGAVELFRAEEDVARMEERIRELEALSLLDELTRLPNRRYLENLMRERLDMLVRYGSGFHLLFMDLDRFKSINDQFGHGAGDRLLQSVAGTFRHNLRRSDQVGRWGGDEFLGILSDAEESSVPVVAAKLLRLVAATATNHDGRDLRTTISIGMTRARPEDTPDSLLERADAQLLRCKKTGRNRCCRDQEDGGRGQMVDGG